jgi:hypothetical protein
VYSRWIRYRRPILLLTRLLPLFNKDERESEQTYYREENDERIDYLDSSRELKKAPPPPQHVTFKMLISTKVQCEGDSTRLKSYDVYEHIEREVAQQWSKGSSGKSRPATVSTRTRPKS